MPDIVTKDSSAEVRYPPSILEDVNKLVQRVQTFTGATGAAIALREGTEMVCRASRGNNAPDVGMELSLDGTFTGLAVIGMKAVRCDDAENDPRVDLEVSRALRIKSMAVVPVLSGMRVTGVIATFSGIGNAFSDTHMAVLKTMADGLGAGIERWLESQGRNAAAVFSPLKPGAETPRSAAPAPKVETPAPAIAAPAPVPAMEKTPETKPAKKSESQGKWKPVTAPKQEEPAAPEVKAEAKPKAEPKPQPKSEIVFTAPSFATEQKSEGNKSKSMLIVGIAAAVLVIAGGAYFALGHKSQTPVSASAPAVTTPAPASTSAPLPAATTSAPVAAATPKPVPAKPNDKPAVKSPPTQIADTTRALTPMVVQPSTGPAQQQDVAPPSLSLAANAGPAFDIPVTTSAPKLSAPAPANAVVVPSRLLQRVSPSYPMAARQYRVEGAVTLSATIASDGHVREAKVISGPPLLRDSAISAVKQWKYAPSTVNGRAVESTVQIVLQFKMPS
jgi:protein TonB